ncbi:hypothetical protein AVEN_232265-1 [Araneus ventricosus]|uniref:Uncharacterized protein n=1 Tax=Araneus ventricosus TaxID=182803 RepID=A0A4Y2GT01_ARAVE|nr:hypothetical protein AVEN_232265-1 [Araneus ventricosus]
MIRSTRTLAAITGIFSGTHVHIRFTSGTARESLDVGTPSGIIVHNVKSVIVSETGQSSIGLRSRFGPSHQEISQVPLHWNLVMEGQLGLMFHLCASSLGIIEFTDFQHPVRNVAQFYFF